MRHEPIWAQIGQEPASPSHPVLTGCNLAIIVASMKLSVEHFSISARKWELKPMAGIRLSRHILLALFALTLPSVASAQVEVSSAQWTSAKTFKFCNEGNCETFRDIKLSSDTIALGQNISVINTQNGETVSSFLVKSIKYGRQVKMCWLGDSEGQSGTYITVGGCKM